VPDISGIPDPREEPEWRDQLVQPDSIDPRALRPIPR
jgi:hypothetical protein